ncbi:MAG: DUF4192 domain-containing protein [Actinomycetia bacterium]|nr:DUF4192 domain-containing protein [Actinomycetes bacterium]
MSLPLPAGDPAHACQPSVEPRPTLRASGPSEILQVIPYLLGFHPEHSVVIVAMRGMAVVVSARYDLHAPPEYAEPLCHSAAAAGATGVLVALYDDTITGHPLAHRAYRDELREVFDKYELNEVDALAVGGGRWWSYRCEDDSCCPADGTELVTAGAVAASAVAEGLVALPGRADLEAELEPDAGRMADVLVALLALGGEEGERPDVVLRAEDWAAVRHFVRDARRGVGVPPPEQAARVLSALMDIAVRDATVGFLTSRPERDVEVAWRDLVRAAPPLWRAPVATIYALWCQAGGSGARANIAIEAALAANPYYSMAQLLDEAQLRGMNPHEFIAGVAGDCRRVGRRIQRNRSPWGKPARRAD